jgi:hypothetical protein
LRTWATFVVFSSATNDTSPFTKASSTSLALF